MVIPFVCKFLVNKNIKTECDYFKDNTAEDLKKKFGIEKEKKTELEME